jgi:hypothetical protein
VPVVPSRRQAATSTIAFEIGATTQSKMASSPGSIGPAATRHPALAKTISTTLDREMLEQVVLDGFFVRIGISDVPSESRIGGLREFGLPYASDPLVSKHIARFLNGSLQNVKASEKLAALVGARTETDTPVPTAVLFNGGVFKAARIRSLILDCLRGTWKRSPSAIICNLPHGQSPQVPHPKITPCRTAPSDRGISWQPRGARGRGSVREYHRCPRRWR